MNRDEAEKARELAERYVAANDLAKAIALLRKSARLAPSAAVDARVAELERRLAAASGSGGGGGGGDRRRA